MLALQGLAWPRRACPWLRRTCTQSCAPTRQIHTQTCTHTRAHTRTSAHTYKHFSAHPHPRSEFYPGLGQVTDMGSGQGRGYTVNIPWQVGRRGLPPPPEGATCAWRAAGREAAGGQAPPNGFIGIQKGCMDTLNVLWMADGFIRWHQGQLAPLGASLLWGGGCGGGARLSGLALP